MSRRSTLCIATTRPPRRWVVQRMDGVRRTTRRAENAKKRERLIRSAYDRLKRSDRSSGGLCSPNTYTHRLRSARDLWGDSGLLRRSRLRTVLSRSQPPAVLCCPDTYTQRHAAANLPCEDLHLSLTPILLSFGDKSSVSKTACCSTSTKDWPSLWIKLELCLYIS